MKTTMRMNGKRAGLHGNRILVLANHCPYPATHGAKIRIWSLLRALAAEGYETDLVCLADRSELQQAEHAIHEVCASIEVIHTDLGSLSKGNGIWPRLSPLLRRVPYGVARCHSNDMQEAIVRRLERGNIAAVLCEETYALVNLPRALGVPLIVDHHNAEHVLLKRYMEYERNPAKRAYAALEAANLRKWERITTERSDLALVCSEADRAIYQELCPNAQTAVVPNAIDTDTYTGLGEPDSRVVLYTGGMDWYPNRDAVEHFVFSILPELRVLAPGVRFVVAGRNPFPEFRKRFAGIPDVEFTGTVADMRPEIARAAVSVVPLRIGSGTRLKILEAAAMRKPIVSTSVGAEGLDFVNHREIILADDPGDFARAVASLLGDAGLRRRLGDASRRVIEQRYSLGALRSALRAAFEKLPTLQRDVALSQPIARGIRN